MEATEVDEQLDELHLLDVREDHEFRAGHIDGIQHIPMGELSARQDEIPEEATIVCVCRSGDRSGTVADALARAGYDAHNLDGGMHAWAATGGDVVATDGNPGRVV